MKSPLALCVIVLATAWSSSDCKAAITADFTGGFGTTRPEQFPGTAGVGWARGWGVSADGAGLDLQVISTSPLRAGGNYLKWNTDGSFPDARSALNRVYTDYDNGTPADPLDDVRTQQRHVISLDLRVDAGLSTFTSARDYIWINGGDEGFPLPEASWFVAAYGANNNGAIGNRWAFYNGNGNGGGTFLDTGLTITAGSVYHFTIDIDPSTSTWNATVADETASFTTPTSLGFRFPQGAGDPAIHLAVGMSDGPETRGLSIDSLRIAPIPEPGTGSILVAGITLVCGMRWRLPARQRG